MLESLWVLLWLHHSRRIPAPYPIMSLHFSFLLSFIQFSRYPRRLPGGFHGSHSSQSVVGSSGLEPPTSRLSGVRSNHLSYEPTSGGDEEVRTPDPLRARQVLSQLSYTPIPGMVSVFRVL